MRTSCVLCHYFSHAVVQSTLHNFTVWGLKACQRWRQGTPWGQKPASGLQTFRSHPPPPPLPHIHASPHPNAAQRHTSTERVEVRWTGGTSRQSYSAFGSAPTLLALSLHLCG
mmetsp:Transcript_48571/g.79943  ORF Transcript_48571/g.79943 Transcript_48571/m.79943 type:complete len:113 (+) Transcript_48571:133-471(+)